MNTQKANENLKSCYCMDFQTVSEEIDNVSKRGLFYTFAYLDKQTAQEVQKAGFRLIKHQTFDEFNEYKICWGEPESSSCCII